MADGHFARHLEQAVETGRQDAIRPEVATGRNACGDAVALTAPGVEMEIVVTGAHFGIAHRDVEGWNVGNRYCLQMITGGRPACMHA